MTKLTTPVMIGPMVAALVRQLDGEPVRVPVIPQAGCKHGECFAGVSRLVGETGGEMVTGWCIWERPRAWAEAEHHAIWRREDGSLIDPTPKPDGETEILFVPGETIEPGHGQNVALTHEVEGIGQRITPLDGSAATLLGEHLFAASPLKLFVLDLKALAAGTDARVTHDHGILRIVRSPTMCLADHPSTGRSITDLSSSPGWRYAHDMRSLSHAEILSMMEPAGRITVRDHGPGLDIKIDADPKNEQPAVYAWVSEGKILYIGKAGRGLARRMRQHSNGFRNSARGKSHAEFLIPLIAGGMPVKLYALWPGPVDVKGYPIPIHSAVEDWLIALADPTPVRNRQFGRSVDVA